MPELPEVETVRTALAEVMTSAVITKAEIRRPDLRWPLPVDLGPKITNQTIKFVSRRAKVMVIGIGDYALLWHLGMSGSIQISAHKPNSKPHDHIELTIKSAGTSDHNDGHNDDDTHYITYHDPRRFGYVDLVSLSDLRRHPSMSALGPEPVAITDSHSAALGQYLDLHTLDMAHLQTCLSACRAPVKSALLDQRKIAGLGNIYVCEALYRAGISPRRRSDTIKGKRTERLMEAIGSVLHDAILQGGTSLRDHKQPDGKLGYFVQSLDVYGRQGAPCHHCQSPIAIIKQSGRSSFYCPRCQR